MYGPIDGAKGYTFNIKPEPGTVMEVTVSLPFSKKKAAKLGKSEGEALRKREERLVRHGETQYAARAPQSPKYRPVLEVTGSYASGVRGQGLPTFGQSEEGPLFRVQKPDDDEGCVILPVEGGTTKGIGSEGPIQLTRKDVTKFLKNATELKSYPEESYRIIGMWSNDLGVGDIIRHGRILYDAALLKEFYKNERRLVFSVVSFMIWLLQHFPAEYVKEIPMSADDAAKIRKFLWLTYGVAQFPAPAV